MVTNKHSTWKYFAVLIFAVFTNIITSYADTQDIGWYSGGTITCDNNTDDYSSVRCYVPFNKTTTLTLKRNNSGSVVVYWQIATGDNEPNYTNDSNLPTGQTELVSWKMKGKDETVQVTIKPSEIGKQLQVKTQIAPKIYVIGRAHDSSFYIITASYLYGITYDYNGGNVGGESSKTIDFDASGDKDDSSRTISDITTVSGYAQPVRPYYNFTGWDKSAVTITGQVNVRKRATVTALWAPYTYTVKFDSNGADSGAISDQGFTYDSAQNLNANQFVKTGYSFNGWNTKKDGSGTAYTDRQLVSNLTGTDNGTVTLYAQWTPLYKYSLTYDPNGGTGGPGTFTSGSEWITNSTYTFNVSPIQPSRTGYSFKGWFDAASGGNEIGNTVTLTGVDGETASKTVYAHWDIQKYTVTGSITPSGTGSVINGSQYVEHGNKCASMVFTPATGYKISGVTVNDVSLSTGWSDASYTFEQTITENTTIVVTTLAINYTIELNANGGTVTPDQVTYNIATNITLPTPERTFYTLAGWKVTTASGNWVNGKIYTTAELGTGMYGNVTLTAQWTKDEYTITFENGGGPITPDSITYDPEDIITLPKLEDSAWEYHVFRGWTVKEDSGNWSKDEVFPSYTSGGLEIPEGRYGNVTLVAYWAETAADVIVSVSGLTSESDEVIFLVNSTSSGKYGPKYKFTLTAAKSSIMLKGLALDNYCVAALSWSSTENITSVVNPDSTTETHENAGGGYEFKFKATPKSSPRPHAESSKNNVF